MTLTGIIIYLALVLVVALFFRGAYSGIDQRREDEEQARCLGRKL
jgi:hypothetical protein